MPPTVDRLNDISHTARMELVSFLKPFFAPYKSGVRNTGGGTKDRELVVVFDGMGSVLAVGTGDGSLDVPLDFASTITGWVMLADPTGSVEVDIWKTPYASFPPSSMDSITASAKPAISSGQSNEDTALVGWTTTIAAGDTLRFNIDSATAVTRVTLALSLKET